MTYYFVDYPTLAKHTVGTTLKSGARRFNYLGDLSSRRSNYLGRLDRNYLNYLGNYLEDKIRYFWSSAPLPNLLLACGYRFLSRGHYFMNVFENLSMTSLHCRCNLSLWELTEKSVASCMNSYTHANSCD